MSSEAKHENTNGHGSYERQDLKPSGILYFLLALGVATLLCILAIKGLYSFLERREKASQPSVNPLITNRPEDTRHVERGYPQSVFPNPKLEEDERGQLDDIRTNEDKTLYSYGWVDEKAGTVHVPIERAMDLLVQRGLPVRPQSAVNENAAAKPVTGNKESSQIKASKKDVKK
jgi:hypothetical protein